MAPGPVPVGAASVGQVKLGHATTVVAFPLALALADEIPDLVDIDLPAGAQALVVADVHLSCNPTPKDGERTAMLARKIAGETSPGALVIAGNLLDSPGDPSAALDAHPALRDAISSFSAGESRRVVVLAGDRDSPLAADAGYRQVVLSALHAEASLAADLHVRGSDEVRTVRVESGRTFDPLSAPSDPRNSLDSPYASHVRALVVPALRSRTASGRRHLLARRDASGWLSGLERLDEVGSLSRFVVSRLVYRRLVHASWLIVAAFVAALALRVPAAVLSSARHGGLDTRFGLFAVAVAVELILLFGMATAAIRTTNRALGALAVEDAAVTDPNARARSAARCLIGDGYWGLITGHTCRAELTNLGSGFYANAGAFAEVVSGFPSRLPGIGLPAPFLSRSVASWLELRSDATGPSISLSHSCVDLPGSTLLERIVAKRAERPTSLGRFPALVARFPQGESWPPRRSAERRDRRVRRLAALLLMAVGFGSLLSAMSDPAADRLTFIRNLFPLIVPEVAAAGAAFFGVGLIVIARSVRRGQRRAWVVCELLLVGVAILHLIKGIDVGEVTVALVSAALLYVYRESFRAQSDVLAAGRGMATVAVAATLVVAAGTLAVELSTTLDHARNALNPKVSWPHAFEAALARMVGSSTVTLPPRIDTFLSPAMLTASVGLLVAALVVVFRPVVARRGLTAGLPHDVTGSSVPPSAGTATGLPADLVRSSARVGATADGTVVSGPEGLSLARDVVERHGSGTLDYFALRPDKSFFLWGDTLVAHAVYGSVCLVSPDPIGPAAEREEAWHRFRRYVDIRGWALGGLGAGADWLPIYRSTGMRDIYVGDEAVVDLERFSLEGGRHKSLRQAVNRVAKYGYTATFHDPREIGDELRKSLSVVMTKSRRGDVERGFSMTLGRVFDSHDRGLLMTVVHAPAGESGPTRPVAFCQFVPAPGIEGFSLDLMRRDDGDHPNGLIDFAVVETIRELKARSMRGLGLNFATMRAVLAGEAGQGPLVNLKARALKRLGGQMQIESLWKFNAKFDPDWLARYAVYDAPEHLIDVAVAIARAESFWELPLVGRFLVPPADAG